MTPNLLNPTWSSVNLLFRGGQPEVNGTKPKALSQHVCKGSPRPRTTTCATSLWRLNAGAAPSPAPPAGQEQLLWRNKTVIWCGSVVLKFYMQSLRKSWQSLRKGSMVRALGIIITIPPGDLPISRNSESFSRHRALGRTLRSCICAFNIRRK